MALTDGCHFKIYKNDQYLVDLFISNGKTDYWHTSSASFVIQLDRDDKVTVQPDRELRIYGVSSYQGTCITFVKVKWNNSESVNILFVSHLLCCNLCLYV